MYQSKPKHRIVCTYNHDYTKEFKDVEAGVIPKHRLLLLPEHFDDNHSIFYITSSRYSRWFHSWKLAQSVLMTLHQSRFDEVFCTTESSAWFVLLFKRVGLLKLPVTVVNVAMLKPAYRKSLVIGLLSWLLQGANSVVSYASFQLPILSDRFQIPIDRQRYSKFQIDREFITKYKRNPVGDYILSVGSNQGRDFRTLIEAVGQSARLIICTDQYNKEIIVTSNSYSKDLHDVRTYVPYLTLLKLYGECKLFISCLHDVEFSSGQTVLQEAMLLSIKVVVTDVPIIQDYVTTDGVSENVQLVPVNDVKSLREVINVSLR
jgi:glycosyltransferase involved in cell wall biosynthesis